MKHAKERLALDIVNNLFDSFEEKTGSYDDLFRRVRKNPVLFKSIQYLLDICLTYEGDNEGINQRLTAVLVGATQEFSEVLKPLLVAEKLLGRDDDGE